MSIYVFKTSIRPKDIRAVNTVLRSLIPACTWNFDLEDADNILRIESEEHITERVCFHLAAQGFYCEELE